MGALNSNEKISPKKNEGRLPENIMNFGRILRAAGLPIGPGQIIRAAEAVAQIGIMDREIFYWTLHAVYINRREHKELFDQAFHIFWRNPHLLEKMMQMVLPTFKTGEPKTNDKEIIRRINDALNKEDNQKEQDKTNVGEQKV